MATVMKELSLRAVFITLSTVTEPAAGVVALAI
jgi:hypothetical protein